MIGIMLSEYNKGRENFNRLKELSKKTARHTELFGTAVETVQQWSSKNISKSLNELLEEKLK